LTTVEHNLSALGVPYAIEVLDQTPKQRYVEMPIVEIDF
jgi:hypothetical protein